MIINFKTKNIRVNNEIKEYAEQKAATLLKFINTDKDIPRFDIELSKDARRLGGEIYRADMIVVSGGLDMHAVGHGESLEAAIDIAKDELARRLRRNKTKKRDLFLKGKRMLKKIARTVWTR